MAATMLQVFFDRVNELGSGRTALAAHRDGAWREWSWA